MKRSYETLRASHISWKRRDILSANARGSTPSRARRLGHFQAMLVGACLEADVAPCAALEARDRIGRDRLIGMADMRRPVGIADRGGDVEGLGHAAAGPSGGGLALQGSAAARPRPACRRAGRRSPPGRATGAARSRPARAPSHKRRARARAAPSAARASRGDQRRRQVEERRVALGRAFLAELDASSERRALVGSPWRRIASAASSSLARSSPAKASARPADPTDMAMIRCALRGAELRRSRFED